MLAHLEHHQIKHECYWEGTKSVIRISKLGGPYELAAVTFSYRIMPDSMGHVDKHFKEKQRGMKNGFVPVMEFLDANGMFESFNREIA